MISPPPPSLPAMSVPGSLYWRLGVCRRLRGLLVLGVFGGGRALSSMRCCGSDWPGLCLFCCQHLSCVLADRVDFGHFCFITFPTLPPPPVVQDKHPIPSTILFFVSQMLATRLDSVVFFFFFVVVVVVVVACFYILIIPPPVIQPMRCCGSDWPGLLFVLLSTSTVCCY